MRYLRQKVGGFTLPELAIVLIAVGILLSAAMMRFNNTNLTASANIDKVSDHIQLMQYIALHRDDVCGINFQATSYQLACFGGAIPGLSQTQYNLAPGASFVTSGNTLRFNRLGVPCNDANGATPIAAQFSVSVVSGTKTSSLNITPETGLVVRP